MGVYEPYFAGGVMESLQNDMIPLTGYYQWLPNHTTSIHLYQSWFIDFMSIFFPYVATAIRSYSYGFLDN